MSGAEEHVTRQTGYVEQFAEVDEQPVESYITLCRLATFSNVLQIVANVRGQFTFTTLRVTRGRTFRAIRYDCRSGQPVQEMASLQHRCARGALRPGQA